MEPAQRKDPEQRLRATVPEISNLLEVLNQVFERSLYKPEDPQQNLQAERACIIVARLHDGNLQFIKENYQGTASRSSPFSLMSSTKSVLSILFGMMKERGLIDLDHKVSQHLPELNNNPLGKISMDQLLSHRGGFDFKDGVQLVANARMLKKYLTETLQQDFPPGERAIYSNEGVQLLTYCMEQALLRRSDPVSLQEFARANLFEPLHFTDSAKFRSFSDGSTIGFGDFSCSPHDFLKFGMLLLQSGMYEGKQIVSKEWVELATTPKGDVLFNRGGELRPCGYLFWQNPMELPGYSTIGFLNNNLYIIPDSRLLVFRGHNLGAMPPQFIDQFTTVNEHTGEKLIDYSKAHWHHTEPAAMAAAPFEREAIPIVTRMHQALLLKE